MDFHERRRATAWMRPSFEHAAAAADDLQPRNEEPDDGCGAGPTTLEAGRLYRRVGGVDEQARPVTPEELAALGDPMAVLFFRRGVFPMTVHDLLARLPQPPGGLPNAVYLIGEAGQIPLDASPAPFRDFRFAITRTALQNKDVDLLVSTGAGDDPTTTFLQVAAWDPVAGVFNYYSRISPSWVWAGDSWRALAQESRGRGCFDSHINGSVVMKELNLPWSNWQSQAATIHLAPDSPVRSDPLFAQVVGAENLELTVRALVSRWTAARLKAVTGTGTVEQPDHLMRQLFTTTSVNLASSAVQSATVTATSGDFALPLGFWLNREALIDDLALPVTASLPRVPAAEYVASLTEFGFRLEEGASGFSQPGDTFFAFTAPEAAFEDNDVIRQMVQTGLVPAKFAACALMVDFTNPVFSADRARLMAYVPTGATAVGALAGQIAQAITEAAEKLPATSPEARFAADWALADTDWPKIFAERIDAYLGRVAARIGTPSGFRDYVRLAESRRRDFKRMRLDEFELTLPATDIPADAPRLKMLDDATVVPAP
ncbi:hypothetical protein F7Q99_32105 [Streptomyces kaniharaensis]|uniref:Uncharacterized protein n=1 Tax=Streptomyces kaniharaensis TaxID=212423 RepID=A0A6N7L1K1_9ACTN|nr:hypothetical protein [Streptomyces kaniharaensis]MQS16709.1 hypothetical protein [Streptomyces kaniharaensis]